MAAPGFTVVVAGGTLARGAGWTLFGDEPVLVLGDLLILEGRSNYLTHALAIAAGLEPVWGVSGECDEAGGGDGLVDTPHASGRNYDCRPNHLSGCTGEPELASNYMDARYCPMEFSWTPGQSAILAASDVAAAFATCVSGDDVSVPCGITVSPNPVNVGAATLTVPERWLGQEGLGRQVIVHSIREQSYEAPLRPEHASASMFANSGLHFVSITEAGEEVCVDKIVVVR